jgi:hypothetical protein
MCVVRALEHTSNSSSTCRLVKKSVRAAKKNRQACSPSIIIERIRRDQRQVDVTSASSENARSENPLYLMRRATHQQLQTLRDLRLRKCITINKYATRQVPRGERRERKDLFSGSGGVNRVVCNSPAPSSSKVPRSALLLLLETGRVWSLTRLLRLALLLSGAFSLSRSRSNHIIRSTNDLILGGHWCFLLYG